MARDSRSSKIRCKLCKALFPMRCAPSQGRFQLAVTGKACVLRMCMCVHEPVGPETLFRTSSRAKNAMLGPSLAVQTHRCPRKSKVFSSILPCMLSHAVTSFRRAGLLASSVDLRCHQTLEDLE